jgi:hypothetical protein
MRYQLVLQWPTAAVLGSYEKLIEIEDLLVERLGKLGEVDGHDIGSEELNIFILTDNPRACFEGVKSILESGDTWASVRVAYREISENEYEVLFPKSLKTFKIA